MAFALYSNSAIFATVVADTHVGVLVVHVGLLVVGRAAEDMLSLAD
jgi:hypothetical protein